MPSGIKKIFVTPLTAVDTTPKEALGTIRFEGAKVYKYVKMLNASATVAVVAGDPVGYKVAGYAGSVVVSDLTDSQTKPVCAGVMLASCAGVSGTAYYHWVQIKGASTPNENLAGSTPADGDAIFLSTADKTFTLATAADDPVCGYIDDDSAQLIVLDCVW